MDDYHQPRLVAEPFWTTDLTDTPCCESTSAIQLPLVVAITTIGVDQHLMGPSTAVALVTAAALSVLLFPTLALALRREELVPDSQEVRPALP